MEASKWPGLVSSLSEVTSPPGAEVRAGPWLPEAMPLSRVRLWLRCAASKPTGMESPLVW